MRLKGEATVEDVARSLHARGRATALDIAAAESALGFQFPVELCTFVERADGAEGFVGNGYVAMWRVSDLKELNELAATQRYAPGMVAFGTDGESSLYALDVRQSEATFVRVPAIRLSWSAAEPLGSDFTQFLNALAGEPTSEGRGIRARWARRFPRRETPDRDLLGKNIWQVHPGHIRGHFSDPRSRAVPLRSMLKSAAWWNEQLAELDAKMRRSEIEVTVADWSIVVANEPPAAIEVFRSKAEVVEDFGAGAERGSGYLFVGVRNAGASRFELVVTLAFSPGGSGLLPGVLLVPEEQRLFIGAGERLLSYTHNARGWTLSWEDKAYAGFSGWRRHGDVVLMLAELEFAAFGVNGEKLWTTFVEPPWYYELDGERVRLDVMGTKSSFPIRRGPEGPGAVV